MEIILDNYTIERIRLELKELGLNDDYIDKVLKENETSLIHGLFSCYHPDDGYICYCPSCEKLRNTDRCACMCGSCYTCGYRWVCSGTVPILEITNWIKNISIDRDIIWGNVEDIYPIEYNI